jgi:hypothetical protein
LWNWDEFSSWGSWAKQIFIADTSWREDMFAIYPTYPKGWPMTVAFAQVPFTGYDEYRGIAFLTLFHIALLALTFDVTRLILEKEIKLSKTISFLLSWVILLILISSESSWKLLPPSLLIERPVLYWSIGLFILSFFIFYSKGDQHIIFVLIGLLLASGLSLKTPSLVLTIPAGFIGIMFWINRRKSSEIPIENISAIKIVSYLFGPVLIVASLWSLQSYDKGINTSFPSLFGTISQTQFLIISELIKTESLNYLSSYKFPLTVLSVLGLFSSIFFQRQRNTVLAVLIFSFITWVTLWPLYLFNMSSGDMASTWPHLSSFARYIRLPIRVIHYIGTILFFINLFILLKSKNIFWLKLILADDKLKVICYIVIANLTFIQISSINKVYLDMESRTHGSTTTDLTRAAKIKRFRAEATRLNNLIKKQKLSNPDVLFISQRSAGLSFRMAGYYSIKDQRGGNIQNYKLKEGWSWGLKKENTWMRQTTNKKFGNLILESKIIWPHQLDKWSKNLLAPFIRNSHCKKNLKTYFLIKLNGIFQCVSKY